MEDSRDEENVGNERNSRENYTQDVLVGVKQNDPLSFSQRRFWFLSMLDPGTPAYNLSVTIHWKGTLDVLALEQCFDEILRRHELLRANFRVVDGFPAQIIQPSVSVKLAPTNLEHVLEIDREAEAQRLINEDAQSPFDLEHELLLRIRLLRLYEREHILALTTHRIISDRWSLDVFVNELLKLYEALSKGEDSPLEESPIQYTDFTAWQNELLVGEDLKEDLAYWKKRLAGPLPVLELPTDEARPPSLNYRNRSGIETLSLQQPTCERLKALCREEGATLYMALLAAFALLLHRYTNQRDITIGTPFANRVYDELENLIGPLANTLVLRLALIPDQTFLEILRHVREIYLEACDHHVVPLEKLIEELQPERDLSRTPLFQVVFAQENTFRSPLTLPDHQLSVQITDNEYSQYDLGLFFSESGQEFSGVFQFNPDLYGAATIKRMVGHFNVLIENIVADPTQQISNIPILTEAEQRQLLVEWNSTERALPPQPCVHRLFEAQAERTPSAAAVVCEGRTLTYAELNARANRLARRLVEMGASVEERVGVLLGRTEEMVVGLLGVLKAGGAYVPLDPSYPSERIAFMLRDAQIKVLVTQENLSNSVSGHGLRVLCLDGEWESQAGQDVPNLEVETDQDNLAYVIYTSGSTGRPKGVMVTHHNVTRLFKVTAQLFNFNETDVWTMFHSYAFDFSVWELWGALFYGGRLVVVPSDVRMSAEDFYGLLCRERVTVLNQTPSAFRQLIAAEESLGIASDLALREIIFGGEILEPQSLRPWLERHGDKHPRLVNMYGITETTVHVTYCPITNVDVRRAQGSPIGKRISDLEIYVLNGNGQPVPVGVTGELYVGGAGLSRGYLGQPALTAERFVPHPFSTKAGARLYKTGDLARYRSDRQLEYLGRIDHQVKVRGYRIELGEIEAALAGHQSIRDAVVIAREDIAGHRLVAYVVAGSEGQPGVRSLRNFLQERLPDYMIPSSFVWLDELPLTPNGKLDRRALPAPTHSGLDQHQAAVMPRTPVEEAIAAIWSEVLQLEAVSVHDNFFELGGHSLSATRVVSRLRRTFNVEISLRSIFESPTVAELADRAEALIRSEHVRDTPPIRPTLRNRNLPLSMAQQRLWFLDQLEPGNPAYNIHMAVRVHGRVNVEFLQKAFDEIFRRHEVLRTSFAAVEGTPVQIISDPQSFKLRVIDVSGVPEGSRELELRSLLTEEAHSPFDLTQGPLLRVTLIRLSDDESALGLTMHHIISDAWSINVLLREVSALYEALFTGEEPRLPELSVQYVDFAVWQREIFKGELSEALLTYWRQRLAGMRPVLELPTDKPRPPVLSVRGKTQSLALPEELKRNLKELSRREGVTLFMTLLAAFQILIYRYTRQEDIAIGTPIYGRNRAEVEEVLGFFVNMLVLRTDLSGNPSFTDVLGRVRKVCLEAFTHQELPFEKLVEELRPERSLSHSPLIQVTFQLAITPQETMHWGDLKLSPIKIERRTTQFDLSMDVVETGNEWGASIEYSTDLFNETTIDGLLQHWQRLLTLIVADPSQRISDIPILTKSERHQLLVEWNSTERALPPQPCVHRLFEAQAERTPSAAAVVCEGRTLTYAELNARANRLARRLVEMGASVEERVGVLLGRTEEMVVGLLGVLKAGGAYVPLDPSYPSERIAFMLRDAGVRMVVTGRREAKFLADSGMLVVTLDHAWERFDDQPTENLRRTPDGDNLAYVIYTSGSTGIPKGVAISHLSLLNHSAAVSNCYDLQAGDRVLQFASISFDVAAEEIFPTLLSGGAILLRKGMVDIGGEILRLVEQQKVTVLNLPSTAWNELVATAEYQEKRLPPSLRMMIVGSERVSVKTYATWQSLASSETRLINAFGITETTITSTTFELKDLGFDLEHKLALPIGRPIANTQVYVLDNNLDPVSIDTPGNLYISGIGLARGYINGPGATAENFLPNPFSERPGARIYRTGDIARYLHDGNLELLGRTDEQVKIRGYRIELMEIELVLDSHPAVLRGAVAAEMSEVPDSLIAFVIPRREALTRRELQNYLRSKLPNYMIPSRFVFLKELPLTPSGKVDHKALLKLKDSQRSDEDGDTPEGVIEDTLASIMEDALNVDELKINDNFFNLGVHSLLMTRVLSRIQSELGIELPLKALFEYPTISSLTQYIEAYRQQQEQVAKQLNEILERASESQIEHPSGRDATVEPETRRHKLTEGGSGKQPEVVRRGVDGTQGMAGREMFEGDSTLLYINLWIEDKQGEATLVPAKLVRGAAYNFMVAIEPWLREQADTTRHFTEPEELKRTPLARLTVEILCPFLEGSVSGYIRRDVNYYAGTGFPLEAFGLKPTEVGRFNLTARLILRGETIYREVLGVEVVASSAEDVSEKTISTSAI